MLTHRDPAMTEELFIRGELESLTTDLETIYQDTTMEFRVNFYMEFMKTEGRLAKPSLTSVKSV